MEYTKGCFTLIRFCCSKGHFCYGGINMGEYDGKIPKPIFILLDNKGKMQYCNINNPKMIEELIEEMKLLQYIGTSDFMKKEIDDYIVSIEKINLGGKTYWVLTIESEVNLLIYKDFSTGLFNRNYWEHLKSQIIKLPGISNYSIIVIDIDNLKELNDKYGHIQGDRAIEIVGYAIKEGMRDNDIAIHYGGDEYLILLPNTTEEGARKVIQRIRKGIAFKCKDEKVIVEISAGIACSDCFYDFEAVAQIADKKMYLEKRGKRK